ncbi:MAG: hypothetical protein EAX86_02110 [Candidatus Heimdallarchaeota archaeon]|nr:hypothetical protein [Candidatus Heimdallarchaeota archaeon]
MNSFFQRISRNRPLVLIGMIIVTIYSFFAFLFALSILIQEFSNSGGYSFSYLLNLILTLLISYPLLFIYLSPIFLCFVLLFQIFSFDLKKIPMKTTLYESIFLPTLYYGSIKVIIPHFEQEHRIISAKEDSNNDLKT